MASLELLRNVYWYVYPAVMLAGLVAFVRGSRVRSQRAMTEHMRDSTLALGRTLLALCLGSVVMAQVVEINGGTSLTWMQHMAIDVPILAVVTMPPRHYWQSVIGGLICTQIILHGVWALVPDNAQEHWLANILVGYAKCLVILLWSGGARVEAALDSAARLADRLVLAARARKLA